MRLKFLAIFMVLIFTASQAFGANDKCDGSFDNIYPESFLESTTGKATVIIASTLAVGAVTYFTAGTGTAAAAGSIATFIGTRVGMMAGYYGIAATNFGLALFGGGSITSGGLGIVGGIAVLNSLGDLALAIAVENVASRVPSNTEKYTMLQLKRPQEASSEVMDELDKLDEITELLQKHGSDPSILDATVDSYYASILKVIDSSDQNDDDYGYNLLVKAVIQYNQNSFSDAMASINQARPYFDEAGVLDYMEALLWLTEGNVDKATQLATMAITNEPDAVIPYILLAQINLDLEKYADAVFFITLGLERADSSDFTLLSMAGNINYYHLKKYDQAIQYYEDALGEVSINEYEAELKLRIGKCYSKLGEHEEAAEWKEDALSEVDDDNPQYAKILEDAWNDSNF